MAKADFCFTYYDGDACRDMSHMNRLERGAYNDIVLQQRKFGWLTLEQIKKVLGRDFEEVWPSINLILVFDEPQKKYYVDWLHKSIETMRAHSRHQSGRGKKGGRGKKKPELNPNETPQKPKQKQKKNLKEDGDVNGNVIEIKNKNESGIDFTKPDIEGDEIIFPLDTRPVRDLWAGWKKSRWENHNARYAMMGEQADLKRLEGMTFQQIEHTITAAMAGGWKNLYPERNGKSATTNRSSKQEQSERARDFLRDHYATELAKRQGNQNGNGTG